MSPLADWVLLGASPVVFGALGLAAVLALASGLRSGRSLPPARRALLLALRLGALALAGLAVLRPAQEVDLTRAMRSPLAVLVDTSRSMTLGPAPAAEAVTGWLGDNGDRLERLREFYRVELFGLGEAPRPLASGDGTPLPEFGDPTTPLGESLHGLARLLPEAAGVVLLSDGQDTETPERPPRDLPFPVYPLLAEGAAAADLALDAVAVPAVGFIRTPVELRLTIRRTGLPAGEAVVTLFEGGSPLLSQSVTLADETTEASLMFTPNRTGRRAYRVELTPWRGEVTLENNRRQFSLNVIRDKTRVLLVAGTPTWDVKFLRRRLRQDPGVDLITFLILRTPQDLSLVPQDELSLIPFPTQELFSEELPSFDAVIFANFDYAPYVPIHYLQNVARFVREDGGGFAMLGGDRSLGLGGYLGSPLEEILPVDISGAAPGQGYSVNPFRPRLTDTGAAHPLFQWRGNPEEDRRVWESLPPMTGMNWVLRARPEAVVLAENPEARNEFGPQPLITLGEYGKGRSLVVASDSLWRWALPNAGAGGDDGVYRDFWTRALRWLIHDPEMELVRLGAPPSPLRQGQTVRFGARVLDRSYQPAAGAVLEGTLASEAGVSRALEWRETGPGEYSTGDVALPAQGLWRLEATAHLEGTLLGWDALEFPVDVASPEGLRVGVNREYLEALAEGSGGRAYPLDGEAWFEDLVRRAESQVEVVGRRVEELWPTPWLWLLSIALFTADWALRRFWEA